MTPKLDPHKSAKSTTATNKKFKGFTAEERVAMKERILELKASARRGPRADKSDAEKFKTRYATFGFSDEASLDEGAMWPTAFALMELTAADEARISALVKKAAG